MIEVTKIKKSAFATLTKVHFSTGLKPGFNNLAEELCINPEAISHEISTGTVTVLGINMNGLCVQNVNGGYEFYNSEYMEEPATLIHPGTTIILTKQNQKSRHCCIFLSLLDYLAYRNLQYEAALPEELSHPCDCFIIGDESNLIDAMLDTDTYGKVFCMFPRHLIGKTITQTFIYRNPNMYIDVSDFYQDYCSLFDYNKNINSYYRLMTECEKCVAHHTNKGITRCDYLGIEIKNGNKIPPCKEKDKPQEFH